MTLSHNDREPRIASGDSQRSSGRAVRARWLAAAACLLALLVMSRAAHRLVFSSPAPAIAGHAEPPASLRIPLNAAAPHELRLLPGVGPTLATRIVEHREERGAFASMEELEDVSGIGEVTRRRVRPWVSLHHASP